MGLPTVSLLLPNFNNEHVLRHVLGRLAEHTTYDQVELVIVDDGSTDRSPGIIREWIASRSFAGDVRFLEQPNGGAISALNTALDSATGEFVVQLDSDASIETPHWVQRLLELMLLDGRVGLVTGKLVMDSGFIQACGIEVVGWEGMHDRPTRPLEPVGRRRWHHRLERVREGAGGSVETEPAEIDAALGCCMMYRREDALAAGAYDINWSPVWIDDVDLCMGIRKLGRKAFYTPEVRVVHHLAGRRGGVPRPPEPVWRRAARRLPVPARSVVEGLFKVDLIGQFDAAQIARLQHHYAYWRAKWGWDLCNPDVDEIRARWGGSEVAWSLQPDLVAAGEEILARYQERRSAA